MTRDHGDKISEDCMQSITADLPLCIVLRHVQVCIQLSTRADNVALFAFADERRAAAAACIESIDISCSGPTAANPPQQSAAVDRRDRQTDGHRTVT